MELSRVNYQYHRRRMDGDERGSRPLAFLNPRDSQLTQSFTILRSIWEDNGGRALAESSKGRTKDSPDVFLPCSWTDCCVVDLPRSSFPGLLPPRSRRHSRGLPPISHFITIRINLRGLSIIRSSKRDSHALDLLPLQLLISPSHRTAARGSASQFPVISNLTCLLS